MPSTPDRGLEILHPANLYDLETTGPINEKDEGSDKGSASFNSNENISFTSEPLLTEHDLRRLQRVPGKLPWGAYTLSLFKMFENLAFSGTFVTYMNFLQHPLPRGSSTGAGHGGQSGALNLGQRTATALSMCKVVLLNITPLFGAYIADQHLGRYLTLQYSSAFALLGHAIMVVAALPWVIPLPQATLAVIVVGFVFISVGWGGCRPNIQPLLVDQIPSDQVVTQKNGKQVIVDHALTRTRALLYLNILANIGSLVGMCGMVYAERNVGFWLSFFVPALVAAICPVILHLSRRAYVHVPPSSSAVTNAFRLCTLAMRGVWSWNLVKMYRDIRDPNFWARVKPSNMADRPLWMTFDDSWVEEVARGLRSCQVFGCYLLYWPALRQMSSNLTSQAATLNLGGVPNDLLIDLDPIFCIVLSPLYMYALYPGIERLGFCFPLARRISLGFLSSALAMASAAVLQHFVYATNPCGKYANACIHRAEPQRSPVSVWLQFPIYALLANSEILAATSATEYAYSQAPANMRSIVIALFVATQALGSAVVQVLLPVSEDPHLVWNYAILSLMSAVAAVGVWWCTRGGDGACEQSKSAR